MAVTNKTFVFKQIPKGMPVPGQDIVVEDRSFNPDEAPPTDGVTTKILWASYDPYLRGLMRDAEIKSYMPAIPLGSPIVNAVIARILKSAHADYKPDDLVFAYLPIAQYATVPFPAQSRMALIHNPHNFELGHFLGALGMPGLTAWSGLHKIGQPKEGETIFVSSAAGAVGQVVGQMGKKRGMKVIGSVGSDEKAKFLVEKLGFDSVFNYKKEKPAGALKRLATDGIDIYFENVGGEHLDAALVHMNRNGRIPVCGMISDYNSPDEERYRPKNLFHVLAKQLTMQGFLVYGRGFGDAYYEEHQKTMQEWMADGSFKAKLHITEGIENAAEGFIGLMKGDNFGKAVLKIG